MTAIPRSTSALMIALATLAAAPSPALAQEPYLGEIRCFGYNFVPRGWAPVDGRLLSIVQNSALFALLGTQFGGDGRTTFALPDMRGRSLVQVGLGPGLTLDTVPGDRGGAETVTLSRLQLPRHSHVVEPLGTSDLATATSPAGKVPATKQTQTFYGDPVNTVKQAATTTRPNGQSEPVPIRSPYLAVTCGIALQGIFPSRD